MLKTIFLNFFLKNLTDVLENILENFNSFRNQNTNVKYSLIEIKNKLTNKTLLTDKNKFLDAKVLIESFNMPEKCYFQFNLAENKKSLLYCFENGKICIDTFNKNPEFKKIKRFENIKLKSNQENPQDFHQNES